MYSCVFTPFSHAYAPFWSHLIPSRAFNSLLQRRYIKFEKDEAKKIKGIKSVIDPWNREKLPVHAHHRDVIVERGVLEPRRTSIDIHAIFQRLTRYIRRQYDVAQELSTSFFTLHTSHFAFVLAYRRHKKEGRRVNIGQTYEGTSLWLRCKILPKVKAKQCIPRRN